MASPFRAFRKYQKTLLAVAGVVLMFVFVLGDPLSQYLRSHSGGTGDAGQRPSDIAVHWNGGKLTNTELGQLVHPTAGGKRLSPSGGGGRPMVRPSMPAASRSRCGWR